VKITYSTYRFPQIPEQVLKNWCVLKGNTDMNADSTTLKVVISVQKYAHKCMLRRNSWDWNTKKINQCQPLQTIGINLLKKKNFAFSYASNQGTISCCQRWLTSNGDNENVRWPCIYYALQKHSSSGKKRKKKAYLLGLCNAFRCQPLDVMISLTSNMSRSLIWLPQLSCLAFQW
jgi:hypothetical protein